MQIIGLTGGIASGKSTCAEYLRNNGIPVIDADEVSRNVLLPRTSAYKKVCKLFPLAVDHKDGRLNRSLLGDLVFNDPKAKKKLESIVHPLVKLEMFKLLAWWWLLGCDRVVLEIPLLFETGLHRLMSYTVCIHATNELQDQRLIERSKLSPEQALIRVNSQMPIERKCEMADVVIDNQDDLDHTYQQLQEQVVKRRPSIIVHRLLFHAAPLAMLFGVAVYSIGVMVIK